MTTGPRVPPLPPEEWGEEERSAYAVLESESTRAIGPASNATMALVRHPKLCKAFYTLGRHLLVESSVPDRLREMVTLRVAVRYRSEYEWYHHVRFALRIGITDAEIEAVKLGSSAPNWRRPERAVLKLVDELCGEGKLSDATWGDLNEILNQQQIMDLVYTVGNYIMTALALSALQIGIEPGFDNKGHPLS